MANPILHGEVRGGRINFDAPEHVKRLVASLEGRRVEMVLRREVKHKSGSQRRYFHVCVKRLADHCGNSKDYMKALLKLKFLWDGETVDKAGLPIVPSTEDLSMEQYAELIDNTIILAAKYDCVIESPWHVEA